MNVQPSPSLFTSLDLSPLVLTLESLALAPNGSPIVRFDSQHKAVGSGKGQSLEPLDMVTQCWVKIAVH